MAEAKDGWKCTGCGKKMLKQGPHECNGHHSKGPFGWKRCMVLVPHRKTKAFTKRFERQYIQIEEAYTAGVSIEQIAKSIGRSTDRVRECLRSKGQEHLHHLREMNKSARLEKIVKKCTPLCREKGMELTEEEMRRAIPPKQRRDIPHKVIRQALIEAGLDRPGQVQEAFAAGASMPQIAKTMNVTRERIRQCLVSKGQQHYQRLLEKNHSARMEKILEKCIPLCREKSMALIMDEIREAIPLEERRGISCEAIQQALVGKGFKPSMYGRRRSKAELLADFRELGMKLGYTPAVKDLVKYGPCCAYTLRQHFGSMRQAQQLAGFKPNVQRSGLKANPLPSALGKEQASQ